MKPRKKDRVCPIEADLKAIVDFVAGKSSPISKMPPREQGEALERLILSLAGRIEGERP